MDKRSKDLIAKTKVNAKESGIAPPDLTPAETELMADHLDGIVGGGPSGPAWYSDLTTYEPEQPDPA